MKDKNGLFYYPFPENKRVRMYVKRQKGSIFFRLWNADDQTLWKEHGWVPYEAIRQASAMFTGNAFDPNRAYDRVIAEAVLKEAETEP